MKTSKIAAAEKDNPKKRTQKKTLNTPNRKGLRVKKLTKEKRAERHTNTLYGLSNDFFHLAVPPTKLTINASGKWLPMRCEERRADCFGIPSSHRCMERVSVGGFYENDPNVRFCGKVFCLVCAADRGLPHNTLKCHIHFPGNVCDHINI